jgi:hypothetical protein
VIEFNQKGGYMQVSTVCANRFLTLNNSSVSLPDDNTNNTEETALNTFTSSIKKSDTDMEQVYEWKIFCQEQIMAGKLDYLA